MVVTVSGAGAAAGPRPSRRQQCKRAATLNRRLERSKLLRGDVAKALLQLGRERRLVARALADLQGAHQAHQRVLLQPILAIQLVAVGLQGSERAGSHLPILIGLGLMHTHLVQVRAREVEP